MPRMPRVHLNGVLYYVTQQGAHDRSLFRDAEDHQAYLDFLTQYQSKHQFHLYSYSLLSDKVNLIIEPYGTATISEIMRDLTSRYSKYYNGRYGANGPLFKGRFHTVLAEKETYLPRLIRFVHSLSPQAESFSTSALAYARFAGGELVTGLLAKEIREIASMNQFSTDNHFQQLSLPLSEAEFAGMQQQLKDAVIGSPAFIQKVRTEMKEAAAAHDAKPEAQVAAAVPAAAIQGAVFKTGSKMWNLSFLALPVLAIAVGLFLIQKPAAVSNNESVSAAVVAEKVTPSTPVPPTTPIALNGTEWEVKMIPTDKKNVQAVEYDKIRFSDDQVVSKNMAAKGFQPTFYTLTSNEDGVIIWETMQTGPAGDIVAWRGEWVNGQMRGVINQQMASGETRTFHFVGSK